MSKAGSVRLWMVAVLMAASTAVVLSAGAPAQAVPDLVFVSTTGPSDSRLGKSQIARCPVGLRALSGGGYVGNGAPDVFIDSMRPVWAAKGDYFEVVGSSMTRLDGTGHTDDWFLVAYAVCGSAPAGLEMVGATSPGSFDDSHTATAACPPGKKVIGAGGSVTPAFGFAVLQEMAPVDLFTAVRVTAHRSERPSPIGWGVHAIAVCADPLPGQALVLGSSPTNSLDKSVNVVCPAGTKVHGLGAALFGSGGQAAVYGLFPGQPLNSVSLRAREDHSGFTGTWRARAYAICA